MIPFYSLIFLHKKVPRYFLMNINKTIMLKHVIIFKTPKLLSKNFTFFSPSSIRMSGKNIIFDDKKINKSNVYKNKKLFNIYNIEVDKILISKKEPYGKKSSFKYFLDIMIMMSLDLYV